MNMLAATNNTEIFSTKNALQLQNKAPHTNTTTPQKGI